MAFIEQQKNPLVNISGIVVFKSRLQGTPTKQITYSPSFPDQEKTSKGDIMKNFNPSAGSYEPQNALWLGKAAALAYENEISVSQALQDFKVTQIANPTTDTQGYVAGNSEMVVVSLRGTEPNKLVDWLTDLDAILTSGPVGEVHRGFYDALMSIWADLVSTLQSTRQHKQPIWFTGHSLGAALANLAAAKLLKDEMVESIKGLYTFGQPRTGTRTFADWFDGEMKPQTYRFVNHHDIVPHVPLPPLYMHSGNLIHFDSKGNIHTDEAFWDAMREKLDETAKNLIKDKFIPDEIEDHFMKNYLKRLEQNAGNNPM